MHSDGTLSIHVNGGHRRVRAGLTLAQLASELGWAPEQIAVERNLHAVARDALAEVEVEDGDELEIMPVVGAA